MSRTFYFTGIKLLDHHDVRVERIDIGEKISVRCEILRVPEGLPLDCEVFLEAFDDAFLERFPMGPAASVRSFGPKVLDGLTVDARPRFRVKFVGRDVDGARLLVAVRENIRPEGQEGPGDALLPIVPKSEEDMEGELWRVEAPPAGGFEPQLWLSRDSGVYGDVEGGAPQVVSIILPAAVRQALNQVFLGEENVVEPHVRVRWLEFGVHLTGRQFPEPLSQGDSDAEQIREWIQDVVAEFSTKNRWSEVYAGARGLAGDAEVQS